MSVLPAPVSPVITVMPSPSGSSRSAMIPRFSTRSSTNISAHRSGRSNLALSTWWKSRARRLASRSGSAAAAARHPIAGAELAELAAVEREHDSPVVAHHEPELLAVGEHERPVEQHVRRHRREHQAAQRRRRDRAAHRERVGGRAGRRRDDHAVGGVGRERAAVDRHVEADEVTAALLLQRGLVEREPRPAGRPFDVTRDGEHHALRHGEVAGEQARQRRIELVGLDLGQVSELADVHAEDRHRRRVHEVDRVQHRAVAAERDRRDRDPTRTPRRDTELGEAGRLRLVGGHAHGDVALAKPARRGARQLVRDATIPMRHQPDPALRLRLGSRCARASGSALTRLPVASATTRAMSAASTPAGPRRARAKNSMLPSAPRNGETTSARHRGRARRARRRRRAAPLRAPLDRARSRRARCGRPASNWGFTNSTNSASGVVSASRLGATVRNEMYDRSATHRSAGGSTAPGLELAHVGAFHHGDADRCGASTRAARGPRRSRTRATRPAGGGSR